MSATWDNFIRKLQKDAKRTGVRAVLVFGLTEGEKDEAVGTLWYDQAKLMDGAKLLAAAEDYLEKMKAGGEGE